MIIAGGVGSRSAQEIPKQFLTVNEIPILIYTLQAFQEHEKIDKIIVVTLSGWKEVVAAYCRQFKIHKLSQIIDGGNSRFLSMKNGVKYLDTTESPDDLVLVHDGNRPLVSSDIIDDAIIKCKKYGNALPALACVNSIYKSDNGTTSEETVRRDNLYKGQSPEAMKLSELSKLCDQAASENFGDTIAGMLTHLGATVYLSKGSERNFKITTPGDIDIFKALLTIPKTTPVK